MKARWPVLAVLLTVLGACASSTVQVDPAPTTVGELAPASDAVEEIDLPLGLSGLPVLDPGWDQPPQERDGYFLGLVHPEADEPLRFVAARDDGVLLWQAERPPSCAGYTLSRAGGQPIAVLMDVEPGNDTLTQTSATAYDLATGELLWGPVPVPGPHQGPGTVFAAPAPGAAMGDTGPRVALDPTSGDVLASEEAEDVVVIGEYDGVLLTAADGMLMAQGSATWEVVLLEVGLGAQPVALAGVTAPEGTALLGAPAQESGVLIDVATGEVLAEDVKDAVREPVSATLVTHEGDTLVGYPDVGDRWERPAEGAWLSSAGNLFAYLRTESTVRAINVVTGEVASAYDAAATSPAVPVVVSVRGAAVVQGSELALVATPGQ